jgi:hypothetical protein
MAKFSAYPIQQTNEADDVFLSHQNDSSPPAPLALLHVFWHLSRATSSVAWADDEFSAQHFRDDTILAC